MPTEQGQRRVDQVRQRLDDKSTVTIRKNALLLHKAVESSWGCSCADAHTGHIRLDWHSTGRSPSNTFSLAVPKAKHSTPQNASMVSEWELVSISIQEPRPAPSLPDPLPVLPVQATVQQIPAPATVQLEPKKKKRDWFKDEFRKEVTSVTVVSTPQTTPRKSICDPLDVILDRYLLKPSYIEPWAGAGACITFINHGRNCNPTLVHTY